MLRRSGREQACFYAAGPTAGNASLQRYLVDKVAAGALVYFKSNEELFEAIEEEQCRAQAEQIFSLDGEAAIESELQRLGEGLTRFLCRHTCFFACDPRRRL